jgi:hypothetical protein
MKITGRTADFCGTKEKREENETMTSMWKKANAFFFPGSHFLFPSFFSHDFHRKKEACEATSLCGSLLLVQAF